ncbi:MAG: hypothetical protein V7K38_13130 [Nostoc sp.]
MHSFIAREVTYLYGGFLCYKSYISIYIEYSAGHSSKLPIFAIASFDN